MKTLLCVVMLFAALGRGTGVVPTWDVNEHYTERVVLDCEGLLGAVSEALDEEGVSWNSAVVGGDEFDNSDNAAIGFKEIGIGSVAFDDDAVPYAYYIIEFEPDACVIKDLDVGNKFRLYREATDDYPAREMNFVVSAVNGNCVLCVLDAKDGPVLCDSYDENDVVLKVLFGAFGEN